MNTPRFTSDALAQVYPPFEIFPYAILCKFNPCEDDSFIKFDVGICFLNTMIMILPYVWIASLSKRMCIYSEEYLAV
ncbi:MAG: hypothetical protein OXF84_02365 [Bacteroidetes bacterium]|nr:hypothetical protein [Bacteroidota bacterium]